MNQRALLVIVLLTLAGVGCVKSQAPTTKLQTPPPVKASPIQRATHQGWSVTSGSTSKPEALPHSTPDASAPQAPTLPHRALPEATDLPNGSRPFEGARIVRQQLKSPLPVDTNPEVLRFVQDALTFDPGEQEPLLLARYQQIIQTLFRERNFVALDAIADTLRSKRLLKPNGTWVLGEFYQALQGQTDLGSEQYVEVLQAWNKQRPQSVSAHYALGDALVLWAWEARGDDWASNVTEEGWKIFGERLREATGFLETAAQTGNDPYAYARLITVGMGLGLPQPKVRAYLDKAWAIDADHVFESSLAYYQYLMPRWHGSDEEQAAFLDEAVAKTRPQLGDGMYAILMDPSKTNHQLDPKRYLKAQEDLVKKSPRSIERFLDLIKTSEKFSGPVRAKELSDQLADGKTEIPLSKGDRLRLRATIDKKYGGAKKVAMPPATRKVTMRGVKYGATKDHILQLLGPPEYTGEFGNDQVELIYPATRRNVSFILDKKSLTVVRMAGGSLEVDGKPSEGPMPYEKLTELLGPPTQIRMEEERVYLLFQQYHLVAYGKVETGDITGSYSFVPDVTVFAGQAVPITLEEWKQKWR